MFLEIMLLFVFGIVLGVLTGIVPGLHPNTILVALLSFLWLLDESPICYVLAFVVSMAVSNTIVNFIPSIFVGAPDTGTCLAVLPGHRFMARGEGYDALMLTVVGGVSVLMLTVLAFPFLLWFIPFIYSTIHHYIHWLLIVILLLLIIQEKGIKKVHALFFFFISGMAGFILMSSLPSREVLFPALTGLFGLSIIITSMLHPITIPEQKKRRMKKYSFIKGSVAGWLAGMFVGILPGIGSSQAGVLANTFLRGNEKDFLIALGGINTANIMFTFIALHAISKTRSGASLVISEIAGQIGIGELCFITIIALLSCFISSIVTLWLGRRSLGLLRRMNYRKLNMGVLFVIIMLVLMFSGITGAIVAIACTFIGMACASLGIRRMYLMGFLMLPTILYFSGYASFTLLLLGL